MIRTEISTDSADFLKEARSQAVFLVTRIGRLRGRGIRIERIGLLFLRFSGLHTKKLQNEFFFVSALISLLAIGEVWRGK